MLVLIHLLRITFCIGLISLFLTPHANSQAYSVQVITHSSVNQTTIGSDQMRRIFSMRQTSWENDKSITVYVLASDHETHTAFTTQMLGLFPYQLERVWNKLVYSGLGEEPIKVSSEQEMIEKVSSRVGAIGYVKSNVDAKRVKVLDVVKG